MLLKYTATVSPSETLSLIELELIVANSELVILHPLPFETIELLSTTMPLQLSAKNPHLEFLDKVFPSIIILLLDFTVTAFS